jgi:hypothetical protein
MSLREEYAAARSRSFEVCLEVDRTFDFEPDRAKRSLTRRGRTLFDDAVDGFLLGRNEVANQLLAKAHKYLEAAHEAHEKPKYGYEPDYDEGYRAADFCYVHWLMTGAHEERLLAEARHHFERYFLQTKGLDRSAVEFETPCLLYTGAYPLLVRIAERCSWTPVTATGRKASGLFFDALRVALATDEADRAQELAQLKRHVAKDLARSVTQPPRARVAYLLHALFLTLVDPPSQIFEGVWTLADRGSKKVFES